MEFVYKKWAWDWIFAYQRNNSLFFPPYFQQRTDVRLRELMEVQLLLIYDGLTKIKLWGWDIIEEMFLIMPSWKIMIYCCESVICLSFNGP